MTAEEESEISIDDRVSCFDYFCQELDNGTLTDLKARALCDHARYSGHHWEAWRISLSIVESRDKITAKIFQIDNQYWQNCEAESLQNQGFTHPNGNGHR